MQVRRLSILGVGLLGGSIGLAARSRLKECKVAGYGHRAATLQAARDMGALDEAYDAIEPAIRDADLIVLCTPVGLLPTLLHQISTGLTPGAIVTDVGSTKRSVVESAERLLPRGVHFVGSHPMAGSEKRGIQFARADLFEGSLCLTTPTPATDASALQQVEEFWRLLGMRTVRLSPAEHDRLLADVSHLPHALAAALVAMQEQQALTLCGKGFLDATRIAAGDAGLWRDILLDNGDNVRQGIRRLIAELGELESLLTHKDADALRNWLDSASARRRSLSDRSD